MVINEIGEMPENLMALLMKLLTQQCQSPSNVYINAPIGQYIGSTQSAYYSGKSGQMDGGITTDLPSIEEMCRAVEATMRRGLWWGNTSWAVVLRVYQLKGYQGGYSQFVREVENWPFENHVKYACNFDAVQKPITSGKLSGPIEKWVQNGAHKQTVVLAQSLLEELDKIKNDSELF